MEIAFRTARLSKLSSSDANMRKALGDVGGGRLAQRLAEMRAADSLEDLRALPAARCHELKANRKGQLSVDLDHPYRLVFEPAENPAPRKPDGGLHREAVTAVIVLEIVDYH